MLLYSKLHLQKKISYPGNHSMGFEREVKVSASVTLTTGYFHQLYSPVRCDLRLYLSHKGINQSLPTTFDLIRSQLAYRHELNHIASFPGCLKLGSMSADATELALRARTPVIYQGALKVTTRLKGVDVDIIGIPDLLIRSDGGYLIRICTAARNVDEQVNPWIARRLQALGLLYERTTGKKPIRLEVLTGDDGLEIVEYAGDNTVTASFLNLLDVIIQDQEPYSPVGWIKCSGCGYRERCMSRAEEKRDLALLHDIDQNLAVQLRRDGVSTVDELVEQYDERKLADVVRPRGTQMQRVGKKATTILLQARSILENREIIIGRPILPFAKNYAVLDLDGLPPRADDLEKVYLWGVKVWGERPGEYHCSLVAPGPEGDRAGWERFLTLAGDILLDYGAIPFVHWHDSERSRIKTYMERYGDRDGIAEQVLAQLVDLVPILNSTVALPVPGYSLTAVEKFAGYQRTRKGDDTERSLALYIGTVEAIDREKSGLLIKEIVDANEADLQATWAVFGWIRSLTEVLDASCR